MKNIFYTVLVLFFVCSVLSAQTVSYGASSAQSIDSVEAPAAGIDLLKQSTKNSNVLGTTASSVAAETAASSQTATKQQTASKQQTAATQKTGAVSQKQVRRSKSSRTVSTASAVQTQQKTATAASTPTPTEIEIETHNGLLAGERASAPEETPAAGTAAEAEQASQEAIAQEELDYAARMMRQAKDEAASGRFIPPAASATIHTAPVNANRKYNPNEFRPGVTWVPSSTTHFTIYTQKRDKGISSSNMGMIFESAYATLRRNIPWMMSDKVRVFVYQDHNSYLKHEPNAQAWTRALAYPTRGEIVVYDEPGKQQDLKEVFTHELVHIFTQKFFDKYKTGRLMTPAWLDEGLAVYMEDQAYSGTKGGPWGQDLKKINFQRSKETQLANFSSSNMFSSARSFSSDKAKSQPVYFMPFDEFMQEGSLASMEGRGKTQDWYFQAYAMVRFLLNPAGSVSPSNRMQFEQFTRLMAQGEQVRDPRTGFPAKDKNGKPVYQPYSAEKAMARSYRYNSAANFEDAFWRWADTIR